MVQGVDGALVGFASAIPQLIIDLWNAVKAGDLHKAMAVQAKITPIKEAGSTAPASPRVKRTPV